jgi:hypothetical protein
LRYHGIGCYDAIPANGQLTSRAYDRCSSGDPGSLAYAYSSASCDALLDNRHRDVFVRVIVVDDQNPLGDEHITLDVNAVFGGNDAVGAYRAIVLDHNGGVTRGIWIGDVQPRALSQRNRIAEADSGSRLPTQLATEMKVHLASFGRERVCQTNPYAMRFVKRTREKVYWIFVRKRLVG